MLHSNICLNKNDALNDAISVIEAFLWHFFIMLSISDLQDRDIFRLLSHLKLKKCEKYNYYT